MSGINELRADQKNSEKSESKVFENLNEKLTENHNAFLEECKKTEQYFKIIEELLTENKARKAKVQKSEDKIDDLEQYSRNKRIFPNYNCLNVVNDTSDPKSKGLHDKEFCSFDVNTSGRFVCAGTAVTDGDAFLMFWDTRQASLLGGYWESHIDDVTQVKFHPGEADRLVTGSTDGLINYYDISQTEEEEALLQSFNTESSVEKLRWHEGSEVTLSCITHTHDLQLWHLEDSAPYNNFTRENIASTLQMNSEELADSLYVADVHSTSQMDQLMVLAGSNSGNGRCLLSAVTSSGKLSPYSYFGGNKQIVRCSWFDPQRQLLVTAGEGGIISLWKYGRTEKATSPSILKAATKFKEKPHKTKTKPY